MNKLPATILNTLAIIFFLLLSACSDMAGHAPRATQSAALAESAGASTQKPPTGKTLYADHCASCHGTYALLTTKEGKSRGNLVHADYSTMISYCSGLPPLTEGAFDLILGSLGELQVAAAKKPVVAKAQALKTKAATDSGT